MVSLSVRLVVAANSAETVQFGESSIFANGISAWQFARHNAYNCSESGS